MLLQLTRNFSPYWGYNMPELPEVQTTVSGLKHYVEGKRIETAVFHRKNIRYPLDTTWLAAMKSRKIVAVKRRAKLIIMQLDSGCLLWHLGMTGSLRISPKDEPKRLHDHVELHLADGHILRFHDPRRFGYLKWFADESTLLQSVAHYGIEPLSDDFDEQYLWQRSRGKKQAVKNFIMNQEIVVGVGNIYACEALFLAGIRPQTACGKISRPRYHNVVKHIKNVLKKAIAQGGTTISDFENADAKPGYFQQELLVYGRANKPCPRCDTAIKTIKLGGRNSFYCPRCQKG